MGSVFNIIIEISQLWKYGPVLYLNDYWNYINWANYILATMIVIVHGMDIDWEKTTLIELCSVAVIL